MHSQQKLEEVAKLFDEVLKDVKTKKGQIPPLTETKTSLINPTALG